MMTDEDNMVEFRFDYLDQAKHLSESTAQRNTTAGNMRWKLAAFFRNKTICINANTEFSFSIIHKNEVI
jgi:hypothetical protein